MALQIDLDRWMLLRFVAAEPGPRPRVRWIALAASELPTADWHALRVAVLPVVTYLGPLAAHLLTGSIVVETVFHIPGAGGFFVHSILNRDGFLLGGVVIVYCALLIVFNLLVDASYALLDRRIRVDG